MSPRDLQTRIKEHVEAQKTKAMPGFDASTVRELEEQQDDSSKLAILERHEEEISDQMQGLKSQIRATRRVQEHVIVDARDIGY